MNIVVHFILPILLVIKYDQAGVTWPWPWVALGSQWIHGAFLLRLSVLWMLSGTHMKTSIKWTELQSTFYLQSGYIPWNFQLYYAKGMLTTKSRSCSQLVKSVLRTSYTWSFWFVRDHQWPYGTKFDQMFSVSLIYKKSCKSHNSGKIRCLNKAQIPKFGYSFIQSMLTSKL